MLWLRGSLLFWVGNHAFGRHRTNPIPSILLHRLDHGKYPLLRLAHPDTSPFANAATQPRLCNTFLGTSNVRGFARGMHGSESRREPRMEERDFFDEKPEQRTHTMTCPHCGQPGEYQRSEEHTSELQSRQ